MEDKKKIIQDILASTESLINEFSKVEENKFNIKPDENSWSAGNIAEHLIILDNYINMILTGKLKPTERNPFEKIETIKYYFLDFNRKLHAPEPILPKNEIIDKKKVLEEFRKNRNILVNIVEANDLELTCLDFIHRLYGELTRAEWVYFIIFHTERHLHQLNKAMRIIDEK